MDRRAILRSVLVAFAVLAAVLFLGRGFLTHGQTSTATGTQQNPANLSDFRHDVEEGIQGVSNDEDAQNNQNEIDDEEDVKAGDQFGDHETIDGEQPDQEIDQDIEVEVEQEGDQGDSDSDAATSTDLGTDNADESANDINAE